MKKTKLVVIMAILSALTPTMAVNPFFETYKTPYQTIPFNKIKTSDYFPAFEEAMKEHTIEVDAIINNPKGPTFDNTIVALERSGSLLNKGW